MIWKSPEAVLPSVSATLVATLTPLLIPLPTAVLVTASVEVANFVFVSGLICIHVGFPVASTAEQYAKILPDTELAPPAT